MLENTLILIENSQIYNFKIDLQTKRKDMVEADVEVRMEPVGIDLGSLTAYCARKVPGKDQYVTIDSKLMKKGVPVCLAYKPDGSRDIV